ncbi:hypothetical protein HYW75_05120 [Candidatus Pacearchaeota archaeon]|nr:hypothetical protein [Candidatus Pacearchaeota archaeon]
MTLENETIDMGIIKNLTRILEYYKDKRVLVVGTTCTGKSTLLKKIEGAQDMDDLVFPLLSKEERNYVCQTPWTEEIGKTMTRLTREKVKVEAGKPVFGTVLLDCDFIVYLNISEYLLNERCKERKVTYEDATKMNEQIRKEVKTSGIRTIEFVVG